MGHEGTAVGETENRGNGESVKRRNGEPGNGRNGTGEFEVRIAKFEESPLTGE